MVLGAVILSQRLDADQLRHVSRIRLGQPDGVDTLRNEASALYRSMYSSGYTLHRDRAASLPEFAKRELASGSRRPRRIHGIAFAVLKDRRIWRSGIYDWIPFCVAELIRPADTRRKVKENWGTNVPGGPAALPSL